RLIGLTVIPQVDNPGEPLVLQLREIGFSRLICYHDLGPDRSHVVHGRFLVFPFGFARVPVGGTTNMMLMLTMPEPIHSNPGSPSHRFRFSLRGMMFAVAVMAVLFSLWIPTFQLMVNWKEFRVDEMCRLGLILLAEAMIVYYIALAGIIARRIIT